MVGRSLQQSRGIGNTGYAVGAPGVQRFVSPDTTGSDKGRRHARGTAAGNDGPTRGGCRGWRRATARDSRQEGNPAGSRTVTSVTSTQSPHVTQANARQAASLLDSLVLVTLLRVLRHIYKRTHFRKTILASWVFRHIHPWRVILGGQRARPTCSRVLRASVPKVCQGQRKRA